MKSALIVLALLYVVTTYSVGEASAQNRYLDEGQSGVGLAGALGQGEDYTQVGAGLTYTVNGRLDFNISVSRSSFDEDEFGEDFSSTVFSPGISAALLRPTDTSVLGVEVGAGYGMASFSGDALDALGWEMSSNAVSAGIDFYLKLSSSPTLQVYPAIGASYVSVSGEIEDSFGNSVDDDVQDVLISGGVGFLVNRNVVITPSFSTFDGSSSWAISLRLMIPTK